MSFVVFLLIHIGVQAVARSIEPPAPYNVQVDTDTLLMTWTPATVERNVTYTVSYMVHYTVHYRRFDEDTWKPVQSCDQIASNSCDVSSAKAESEHGCVRLHVQAGRQGLTSKPVEACTTHNDTCTPKVSLTARPGSLNVHLSRSHILTQWYADHAKHRVFYGKEGEPLEEYEDNVSSVTIDNLEVGQRYCVTVQYVYDIHPVGLPTCPKCVLIPEEGRKHAGIIAGVMVSFLVMVVLIPAGAYVLIFRRKTIKGWLKPPCKIPQDFLLEPLHTRLPDSSPSEERYDTISSITPRE